MDWHKDHFDFESVKPIMIRFAEEIGGAYSMSSSITRERAQEFDNPWAGEFVSKYINPIFTGLSGQPINYKPSLPDDIVKLCPCICVDKIYKSWMIQFRCHRIAFRRQNPMPFGKSDSDAFVVSVQSPIEMTKEFVLKLHERSVLDSFASKIQERNPVPTLLKNWAPRAFGPLGEREYKVDVPVLNNTFSAYASDAELGEEFFNARPIRESLLALPETQVYWVGMEDYFVRGQKLVRADLGLNQASAAEKLQIGMELIQASLDVLKRMELIRY